MAAPSDFQVVKSRKSKKSRQLKNTLSNSQPEGISDPIDLPTFKKRINSCIQELLLSDFFSQTLETITTVLTTVIQRKYGTEKNETRSHAAEVFLGNTDCPTQFSDLEGLSQALKNKESEKDFQDQENDANDNSSKIKVHFLSYGIGRFTSCPIARYQLAFFLVLRDKFGERCTSCSVYDPVFSKQEVAVLEMYNCHVIQENEEGKRICTEPTLAFLPHCGKALYNNLLWRNLATSNYDGLRQLVLIGNSFSHMIESNPRRVLEKTGNYILKLQPYTSEVPLPTTFIHNDIFNDLAVHTFLQFNPRLDSNLFEENLAEPVYNNDDVEFIVK